MPDPDRATAWRMRFQHHCNDMCFYAADWARVDDVPPEERAEAVRALIERLRDVLRGMAW